MRLTKAKSARLFAFALVVVAGIWAGSAVSSSKSTARHEYGLQGFLDVATCQRIEGWAADNTRPNVAINVKIFDGSTLKTTVLANISRQDVVGATGDNGLHGFSIAPPISVYDGQPHAIKATFEDGVTELGTSPKTITCNPITATVIPNPLITSFQVLPRFATLKVALDTTKDATVKVNATFDRDPSFYRISEVSNLQNPVPELKLAQWKAYTPGMSLTFRLDTTKPYGTRNVFMQINAGTSESGASPPKGDGIIFAPPGLTTFVLTGHDLDVFISRARQLGYRFNLIGPAIIGTYPCSNGLRIADYNTQTAPDINTSLNFTESWAGEVFKGGAFLNPFWKVKGIVAPDLFSPEPNADLKLDHINGPLSGRLDDLNRTIYWKRSYRGQHDSLVMCVAPSDPGIPPLVSITLEGPSDKQPVDAFPPTN
jgi:hypothetical protein